jgi:hypothetical protein
MDDGDDNERYPSSARRLRGCRLAALVVMACATGVASAQQVPKPDELGTVRFENWLVFLRHTDASEQWQYSPRFFIPFNLPHGWTFTQRFDPPVIYTNSVGPDNPAGGWKAGIGDWFIEEYFTTPELDRNTTITASVRFVFPTGGSAPFGSSQYQWAPAIGMSYAIPEDGVTISPLARYFMSYHATAEDAAKVRTLYLFPTITFGLRNDWDLSFYAENPVVYNDVIHKWFVPIDVLLTKRVNKSFGFAFGGAYGLVKDDPRYQYVINGRVTFYF